MSLSNEDDEGPYAFAEPVWPPAEWVMPLRKPVTDKAGSVISQLCLREPTDDEHVQIYAHKVDTRRRFAISTITGIPMDTVAQIGVGDAEAAVRYITSFFDVARKIHAWLPPSSPASTDGDR